MARRAIESGRKDLDQRGRSHAHEQFDNSIPRAGGIHDLLAEAARPDRRFDAVIRESIDRVASRTYHGTRSNMTADEHDALRSEAWISDQDPQRSSADTD